jgi:hypothetical protein
MLLRGADLIKTAIACVLMLVALIIAWEIVGNLRAELRQVGHEPVDPGVIAPLVPTPAQTADPLQQQPQSQLEPTALAPLPTLQAVAEITGTVRITGNVRAFPVQNQNNRIGGINEGDEVIFLSRTPDGQWYRVRLGQRHANGSKINDPDGNANGWVRSSLLSEPPADIPVEQVVLPAAPTTEPLPTPTP